MLQAEEDLLVIAAQSGNHKAFDALVCYYQQALLRFAYKLSNDQDLARDAVQDSWIKSTKTLHTLKDPRAFKSWMYRSVKWRVADLQRKQNNTVLVDSENIQISYVDEDNDDGLSRAIDALPTIEKNMIHLFYLDEFKVSEIAIVLGIPEGTVKSRLSRARKMLHEKFNAL